MPTLAATVPDEVFDALAMGGGGRPAAAHLRAAQYGKHLLLVRRVLDAAREAGHPDAGRAEEAWRALTAVQEAAPEAVAATLRHPTVGVWARRTVLALGGHRREDPRVAVLASLAAATALRAGTALRIEVPLDGPTAPLVSLGRAVVGGKGGAIAEVAEGRAVLSSRDGEVTVPDDPHRDGPGWQALRRMETEHAGHGLALLLDDQEPDRMPGADLVPGRLGAREVEHWRTALREAWEILVQDHWTIAQETIDTVFTLTPTRTRDGAHTSATARHAYGNLGLSTPPNPVALALTFAHEVQHAKLTALWDLVPLTLPDDGSRYYAPWRPDPRPAAGLFQGVYAHLGVAGFWRRHRHTVTGAEQERAHAQFAHWRRSTLDAARVLAGSGRLTPEGGRFLPATTRTLEAWQDEPVPAAAAEAADRAAREHLARWVERNGGSPALAAGGGRCG